MSTEASDWSEEPEGFRPDGEPDTQIRQAPPSVVPPAFFDDCPTSDHVAIKMINELKKPYAVERDGIDEMYRRLSLALMVLLANRAEFLP